MSKFRMRLVHEQKSYYGESMEDCILEAATFRIKFDNMDLQECMDEIFAEPKEWAINLGDGWKRHHIKYRMYLASEKKYYYGDSKRNCISQALDAHYDLGIYYHERLSEVENSEKEWAIDKGKGWKPDCYTYRMLLIPVKKYYYGDSKEDCVMEAARFLSGGRGNSNFYLSHYDIEFFTEKKWFINRGDGWKANTYRYCMYLISDQIEYFGDTKGICIYKAAAGRMRADNMDFFERMAEVDAEEKEWFINRGNGWELLSISK